MQALLDKITAFFYDFIEFFLDLIMLFLQIPMSWGLYLLSWIDGLLPGGTDWRAFWSSMPIELINFGLYVGLWECMQIIFTMMAMKGLYNIVRGR